jgi:hypothetical protein
MAVYMVERALPGIAMNDLAAAQQAAIAKAQEMSGAGTPVRYIRSTFVPQDGSCMCLFEAASASMVQALNDAAKLPYTRIIEALDLTP